MTTEKFYENANDAVDKDTLPKGLLNPFSYNYAKISDINKNESSLKAQTNLRVALLCLEMPTDDLRHKDCGLYLPDNSTEQIIDKRSLGRKISFHRDTVIQLENYTSALNTAVGEHKANIICVNELGFPTKEEQPSSEAFEYTKKLASTHNCLIIAGSYHDSRTIYNTGHIYFPHKGKESFCYYHKQVSAKPIELVNVPAVRESQSVRAFGLNIGVIICLDLLDYTSTASLIEPRNNIGLIFVPCFSDNMTPMERVAEDLSKVLPGGVILVNRYKVGGEEFPVRMWFFGRQLTYSKNKTKYPYFSVHSLPKKKGKIILHDINYDWFCSEQQKKSEDCNPYLKYLYGIPAFQGQQPS